MAKKLFVGSLSSTTNEDILKKLFTDIGPVQTVSIIKDNFTGASRWFGFIEMVTEEDAKKAIEKLNGLTFEDRNIVVKEALATQTYTNGRGNRDRRANSNYRGGRRF